METFISDISNKSFPISEKVKAKALSHALLVFIKSKINRFDLNSCLAKSELNELESDFFKFKLLNIKKDQFNDLDEKVVNAIKTKKSLIEDLQSTPAEFTFGQRIADKVASFGGSWTFIIIFGVFIFVWICLNIFILANKGYDPYPFILLNLILSCIAAIQAPIIMMSQNRKEEKDRDRAEKDYRINLKSEFEIRQMHDKLDHLLMHHQDELIKLQEIQIEKLNALLENKK